MGLNPDKHTGLKYGREIREKRSTRIREKQKHAGATNDSQIY